MRIAIFTVFLILASSGVYSQHHISINAGPSIPVSDYSNTNIDDEKSGFAKTGYHLSLDYVNNFTEIFGIKASLGYGGNGLDASALKKEVQSQNNNSITWSVKNESYSMFNIMIGPSLSISKKDLIIDFSLTGGFMNVSHPGFELTATGNNNIAKVKQESVQSGSFAFNTGLGFHYKVSENININLAVDYISGSTKYENVTTTVTAPNTNTQSTISYSNNTSIIAIKTGIGLNL